jgi:hypothetical protein
MRKEVLHPACKSTIAMLSWSESGRYAGILNCTGIFRGKPRHWGMGFPLPNLYR